jgi:hypothetical protein
LLVRCRRHKVSVRCLRSRPGENTPSLGPTVSGFVVELQVSRWPLSGERVRNNGVAKSQCLRVAPCAGRDNRGAGSNENSASRPRRRWQLDAQEKRHLMSDRDGAPGGFRGVRVCYTRYRIAPRIRTWLGWNLEVGLSGYSSHDATAVRSRAQLLPSQIANPRCVSRSSLIS